MLEYKEYEAIKLSKLNEEKKKQEEEEKKKRDKCHDYSGTH
jgi:hypothetical protein